MTISAMGNVSRETFDRLKIYQALLEKWNPRINLVARSTLDHLWERHFVDSLQIYRLARHPVTHWADLGSGGGFPGLVVAIMAIEHGSPDKVSLIESDTRKCAFLRAVIRETGAQASIINDRIEKTVPLGADVVSARALAALPTLLGYVDRHMKPGGMAILPKGATWKNELPEAQRAWSFDYEVAKSRTEDGSVILTTTGVARV